MSFVQPVTLQVIADSAGITKLSADAAKVLAPDVEYRLREIIQVRNSGAILTALAGWAPF